MKLCLRKKKMRDLSTKEHNTLWNLTFRTSRSMMREELLKDHSTAKVIMAIAKECPYRNSIIGWSCITRDNVYFYVRPDMRRNGVGSALLKKVLSMKKRFYVFESSYSRKFYKKKFGFDITNRYRKHVSVSKKS